MKTKHIPLHSQMAAVSGLQKPAIANIIEEYAQHIFVSYKIQVCCGTATL